MPFNSQDTSFNKIHEAAIAAENVNIYEILLVLIIYLTVAVKTSHLDCYTFYEEVRTVITDKRQDETQVVTFMLRLPGMTQRNGRRALPVCGD